MPVRSSSKFSSASLNHADPPKPSGAVAGDVVTVVVSCNGVVTLSDNNGATPFTKDQETQETGQGVTMALFSRRLTGSEADPYVFNSTGTDRISAIAVCFSNPDPSTIYDVAVSANIATGVSSIIANDITTITANAVHVVVATEDGISRVLTPPGGGYTEQQQSTNETISLATKTIPSAGATGGQTFSSGASDAWVGFSFAIKNNNAPKVTVGTVNIGSPPANPQTFSVTLNPGEIFGLGVVTRWVTPPTLTAVTLGGVAMTDTGVGGTTFGGADRIWFYYIVNQASGAQTVSVTYSTTPNNGALIPFTIVDADTSSPVRNAAYATAISTDPAVTVSSAVDDLVIDVLGIEGPVAATWSVKAGGTQLTNDNIASGNLGEGSAWEVGAASVVRDWTITASKAWGIIGASFKPPQSAGPGPAPGTDSLKVTASDAIQPVAVTLSIQESG